MGVALLIAIPAGIIAALRPNSWHDYGAMTTAMIGVSIPEFFLGVLLILCFSLAWDVLPAVGYVPLTQSVCGNLQHMILPAVTLGLARAALLTRLIRASMMEVIRLDYVTTARAKGVRERRRGAEARPEERPHSYRDGAGTPDWFSHGWRHCRRNRLFCPWGGLLRHYRHCPARLSASAGLRAPCLRSPLCW